MAKKKIKDKFVFESAGAEFSDYRKYRYVLHRTWDSSKPAIMFIGLNPSTADETEPDPTIGRVIDFAASWGFGTVYMTNLFGLVSPEPDDLKASNDPLGDNDKYLHETREKCAAVVFAWGNFKIAKERAAEVMKKFPGAKALVLNKNGTPRHPLYVKGTTVPVPFDYNAKFLIPKNKK